MTRKGLGNLSQVLLDTGLWAWEKWFCGMMATIMTVWQMMGYLALLSACRGAQRGGGAAFIGSGG